MQTTRRAPHAKEVIIEVGRVIRADGTIIIRFSNGSQRIVDRRQIGGAK